MITVAILINGQPIVTRSATNQGKPPGGVPSGATAYFVDDGTVIHHRREDGAINLAIAMLKTVKEPFKG